MSTQPTDDEIVALADSTGTAEGGTNGYILPISFARAVLAKWGTPQPANLGFTIETRAGIDVLVWKDGGCQPATSAEVAMWKALAAVQQPVVREPLTPERIEEICADLRNTVGCSNTTLARAIEAEVRKQDTELIRQMLEALENHDGNYKLSKSAGAAVNAAIAAASARLEKAP